MVPWGTGDPISSGDLNTLVFLTEKPPPLSVSIDGGSMSLRCRFQCMRFFTSMAFSFLIIIHLYFHLHYSQQKVL